MAHRSTNFINILACISINTWATLREGGNPHSIGTKRIVCVLGVPRRMIRVHLMRES